MHRISLHPRGLAARTLNFEDWATFLLDSSGARWCSRGIPRPWTWNERVLGCPDVAAISSMAFRATRDEPQLLVPLRLRAGDAERSLFTTLTTFGTPRDVTLDELAVELFFPADDVSEELLRSPAPLPAAASTRSR